MTSHLEPSKIRERQRELSETFDRLADEAVRIGASAMIIAGDMFDSERISERVCDEAISTVRNHPSVTFFYLSGNHEGDALRRTAALPPNMILFGKRWTYFEAGDITVVGRSECAPGMGEELTLDGARRNIAVLHGTLSEGNSSEGVIGRADLSNRGLDYIALGHYHKYRSHKIDERCTAVYSGTPEGRGFDECGELGYVLLELDGSGIRERFVPFAKRRVHEVDVDLYGVGRVSEIALRCEDALRGIPSSDLVRVKLVGRTDRELIKDTAGLERRFGGGFYYFEVKDETKLVINPEDYEKDPSLKGEFIRRVMADASLSESMRTKVLSVGLYALRGESYFDV